MLASPPVSHDALVAHLARLDASAVVTMAERAVADGTSTATLGRELLEAWQSLRDDDGADAATIVAAAAVARRALARATLLGERTDAPSDRGPILVVTTATGGDQLGSEVLAESLQGTGRPVEILAGAADDHDLAAHLRARRPMAVVAAFAEVVDLPVAARVVLAAHEQGIPVIAWGRAFGSEAARADHVDADLWAEDADSARTALDGWAERAPAPRPATPLPSAYLRLEERRAALLAATVNIGGVEERSSEWAERTARTVVAHLGAAVLVEDADILADLLEGERRALRAKDLLEVHLLGLVDALAGALPDDAGPASRYVLDSREHLRRSLLGPRQAKQADDPGRRPLRSLVGAEPARPADASPATSGAGQVFADILLLAALACQTPMAVVSVPQGNGSWSTLSYGFDRRDGLNDPVVFDCIASRSEPVEIPDLTAMPALAGSPLAQLHKARWVYGVALRNPAGTVLGVVAVLDRWNRELARREQRALLAVARQMTSHLLSLRRAPAAAPTTWTPPAPAAASPVPGSEALAGIVGLRRSSALPDGQQLLRSHEVAVLFDVTERTVINWAAAGKLPSLRTIGGHLRFRSEDVLELLAGRTTSRAAR